MFGIVMMAVAAVFLFLMMVVVSAVRAWGIFMVVLVAFLIMVVMMLMLVLFVVMLVMRLVQFLNPLGRGCHSFKIKQAGIQQCVKVHVAIVAGDDICLGLYGVEYGAYAPQFFFAYFVCLVKKYSVAEFYLLDDEVGDIVFC